MSARPCRDKLILASRKYPAEAYQGRARKPGQIQV